MIDKIMRHEWRIIKTERITQTIALLFVLITAYALFNGFSGLRNQREKAEKAVQEQNELYKKTRVSLVEIERQKTEKGESLTAPRYISKQIAPESASSARLALNDFKAFLPPAPLSPVSIGQSDVLPQGYSFAKYQADSPTQPTVGDKSLGGVFPERVYDNPYRRLTGVFDLSFVVIYVYPLIILALGFNLISADKEAGTLALALSQPILLRQLIQGKVAVRASIFGIFGILLPAIALAATQGILMGQVSVWRVILWCVAVAVYGAFWFALAILVSAFGRGSARNAVTLAVCWMILVVLLPTILNLAAQTFFPVPSTIAFADEERAARNEGNAKANRIYDAVSSEFNSRYPIILGDKANEEELARIRFNDILSVPNEEDLLVNYYNKHPERRKNLTMGQLFSAAQIAREEYIEARLASVLSEINTQRVRQQQLVYFAGIISPSISLQYALDTIAGTGKSRHESFLAQFDEFIRTRDALLIAKITDRANILTSEFDALPKFNFKEETLSDVIKRIALPIAGLFVLTGLLYFAGNQFYSRYSVI